MSKQKSKQNLNDTLEVKLAKLNFKARTNICHIIETPKGVLQQQWYMHLAYLPLTTSLESLAESSGWTGWARTGWARPQQLLREVCHLTVEEILMKKGTWL